MTVKAPKDTVAVWPPTKDGHQYSWSNVPETLRSIHAKGGLKTGRVNHKKRLVSVLLPIDRNV